MTTPADVKTVVDAAKYAWDRGTQLLPHNTPAASLKPKNFKVRPLADVKSFALSGERINPQFSAAWTALQTKNGVRPNVPAAATTPAAPPGEVELILKDMAKQLKAWKDAKCPGGRGRGAWWGSPRPGNKSGAKDIPADVAKKVTAIAEKRGWELKHSVSGGVSWHKTGTGADGKPVDFIYHARAADD
jgi:hypothetical protein